MNLINCSIKQLNMTYKLISLKIIKYIYIIWILKYYLFFLYFISRIFIEKIIVGYYRSIYRVNKKITTEYEL